MACLCGDEGSLGGNIDGKCRQGTKVASLSEVRSRAVHWVKVTSQRTATPARQTRNVEQVRSRESE